MAYANAMHGIGVDTAKCGEASGKGVQGKVEGECHMRMNKDGSKVYEIRYDVFDRELANRVWFLGVSAADYLKKQRIGCD